MVEESFFFYSTGMSNRYRQSLRVNMVRENVSVELDYRSIDDDLPLGVWFEFGTKRHWVEPKVLHPAGEQVRGRQTDPIDPEAPDPPLNRRSVQAPQALSWLSGGERFFSRGHWVSGIKPHLIVSNVRADVKVNLWPRILPILERWRTSITSNS